MYFFNFQFTFQDSIIESDPSSTSIEDLGEEESFWRDVVEKISHWLLIVNSSCNIVIYLHKDPKFKVSRKIMIKSTKEILEKLGQRFYTLEKDLRKHQ